MSLSVNEFWNRLADSGLASAETCRQMAVGFAKQHQGRPPADVPTLAGHLIDAKWLSDYQLEQLLADRGAELRRGDYTVLRPAAAPWENWFWATADNGASSALIHTVPLDLPELSRRWLAAHQAIDAPTLQPIRIEHDGRAALVVSSLPPGQSLSGVLESGPCDSAQTLRIGIAVATGLSAMHAAKMPHGSIHPDRVWIGDDQSVWLLREAIAGPGNPLQGQSQWFAPLQPPGLYAAPEFTIPGQASDALTDQYALGCLLLHARLGKPPFSASGPDELLLAHAQQIPAPLRRSLAGEGAGHPLLRVIAHAMAKNAEARFADVRRLLDALVAVQRHSDSSSELRRRKAAGAVSAPPAGPGEESARATEPLAAPVAAASTPPVPPVPSPPVSSPPVSSPPVSSPPVSSPPVSSPPVSSPPVSSPPVSTPPVSTPPVSTPPVSTPPVSTPPVSTPPVSTPPVSSPPVSTPPVSTPPVSTPPVSTSPVSSPPASLLPASLLPVSTPPVSSPPAPAPSVAVPAMPVSAAPPPSAAPAASEGTVSVAEAVTEGKSAKVAPGDTTAAGAHGGADVSRGSGEEKKRDRADSPGSKRRAAAGRKPKKKKKKSMRGPLVIGGLGFAAMMLMVIVLGQSGRKNREVVQTPVVPTPYVPTTPRSNPSSSDPQVDASGYELVDNPRALWSPPTAASPPPLEMIPSGPQMIVVLRPQKLRQSPAGQNLLSAFDKELGTAWERLEARTGVSPDTIERLTLAFDSRGGGIPSIALGVRLVEAVPLSTLQQAWQAEPAQTPEGHTILAAEDGDAFYVSDTATDAAIDRFAVGSIEQIKSVAELQGTPIPLPRQLENLWKSARADAEFNVLLLPNYLFADGRLMLQNYAPESIEPLRTFLQPDAAGLLLTSTLEPQWYLEIRMMPGPGTSAAELAKKTEDAVTQLPTWAERFLLESSPDASWRALALRYPQMLHAIRNYARYGISNDAATANVYLPSQAAPNVALATLLAANTPRGTAPAGVAMTPTSTSKPLTLEEMLELTISVSFDQESLEFAGQAVMDEVATKLPPGSAKPLYIILGPDLQKEGITQNQQIRDFNISGEPLRSVLTELVMRANIVKSVTDASQSEQKLVWVVGANPADPQQQAFLITTRVGAEGKYELPKEFLPE